MESGSPVWGSQSESNSKYRKIWHGNKWVKILTLLKNKTFNVEYLRIQPQIHRGILHLNRNETPEVMQSRSKNNFSLK